MNIVFAKDKPWLAPLAGYTDLAFRLLCREYGASVACTEMVSSKGLLYENIVTQELLKTEMKDSPVVVQLFGNEPDILAYSIKKLREEGFTYFDLNVGCSVQKVTKTGCGVSLMRDIPTLEAVAKAMIESAEEGHVGFKIRLGWNASEESYLEVGKMLENIGAGWITIHPRYAKQGYAGIADWTKTKKLVDTLSIPVIASGDIFSANIAVQCLEETGATTVIFARGALNNPTIFEEYKALLHGEEYIPKDIKVVAKRHVELLEQYVPERRAVMRMRGVIPKYLKHFSNVKALRQEIIKAETFSDIYKILSTL